MSLQSTAIFDRRVYASNTPPDDERDGVLWVDTSDPSRPLAVYSTDSAQWEPVKTDVPVLVTQEAVSFEESGVTLAGLSDLAIRNGTLELPHAVGTQSGSQSVSDQGGWYGGWVETAGRVVGTLEAVVGDSGIDYERARLYDYDAGTALETRTGLNLTAGDVVSFDIDHDGVIGIELRDTSGTQRGYSNTSPDKTGYNQVDFGLGNGGSQYTSDYFNNITELRVTSNSTSVSVQFDSIPTDLQTWDIQTWQQYENQGTLTVDLETNDGTGWATYATNVLPPVDISEVPTDSDVRATFNLSRSAATDTPPRIPYVARRGER